MAKKAKKKAAKKAKKAKKKPRRSSLEGSGGASRSAWATADWNVSNKNGGPWARLFDSSAPHPEERASSPALVEVMR